MMNDDKPDFFCDSLFGRDSSALLGVEARFPAAFAGASGVCDAKTAFWGFE